MLVFFIVLLKNRFIVSKIRISKSTDYANCANQYSVSYLSRNVSAHDCLSLHCLYAKKKFLQLGIFNKQQSVLNLNLENSSRIYTGGLYCLSRFKVNNLIIPYS